MSENNSLGSLFDLTGQVAIVTGGSRGLGFQVAEALVEYGASLLLVARKAPPLEAAAEELRKSGCHVVTLAADMTDFNAAGKIVQTAMDQFGRIDILVNNAGATWGAPAEDYPTEAWLKVLNTNMTGPFLLTQEVARKAMIPNGVGAILNVASVAGLQGHHHSMPGTIAYNTSKGAMINFTRALAAEWGKYGIRVNAIAPGYFPSKMTAGTLEKHQQDLVDRTPLNKLGGPNDLKGPAVLLASAAGGHITGQVLTVDGGAIVI